MKEPVYWHKAGIIERTAVVELCGWDNKKGKATAAGKRLACCSNWEDLPVFARYILTRHGIKP